RGLSAARRPLTRGFGRLAVTALRVVAKLDVSLALCLFLHQIRRGALRARAGDGAVVHRELALRIAIARVEDAAARAALDELALTARRALHARRLRRNAVASADLADVATVGITGAAVERTVTAALHHHLFSAKLTRRLRLG